jgi:GntR family transcriptional regulator / MocR family aminotransferase
MDQLFEIDFERIAQGSRGSSRSLYRQLNAAIQEGRLAPGAKLPATRSSQAFFGVSRNTAAEVYQRLLEEGNVVSRRGSGTYVADRMPSPPPRTAPIEDGPPDPRLNAFWLRADVVAATSFWQDRLVSCPTDT